MDIFKIFSVSEQSCIPVPADNGNGDAAIKVFLPYYTPSDAFLAPGECQYFQLGWNVTGDGSGGFAMQASQMFAAKGVIATFASHSPHEVGLSIVNHSKVPFALYGGMHICDAVFVCVAIKKHTTLIFQDGE